MGLFEEVRRALMYTRLEELAGLLWKMEGEAFGVLREEENHKREMITQWDKEKHMHTHKQVYQRVSKHLLGKENRILEK